MLTVKLTFNYDWPIFRQTPANSGCWGNYQFIIDKNLEKADYWVIFSEYELVEESCICNKENIIFIPAEGYNTSTKYPKSFLNQFGKVLTVQAQIAGKNVIYGQNANPWFIERNYDQLVDLPVPEKKRLLSVVSSDKDFTEGHRKRLQFVRSLKEYFGDKIDVFGRGIMDFDQKWDVTAPYKFHIAVENDYCDDWVTEKFFDPLLTYTYPIYYGCPNMERYMPENSFSKINIDDLEGSIEKIKQLIEDDSVYNRFLEEATGYRKIYLNTLQLFPAVCNLLDGIQVSESVKKTTIYGPIHFNKTSLRGRMRSLAKNILKKLGIYSIVRIQF